MNKKTTPGLLKALRWYHFVAAGGVLLLIISLLMMTAVNNDDPSTLDQQQSPENTQGPTTHAETETTSYSSSGTFTGFGWLTWVLILSPIVFVFLKGGRNIGVMLPVFIGLFVILNMFNVIGTDISAMVNDSNATSAAAASSFKWVFNLLPVFAVLSVLVVCISLYIGRDF